MSKKTVVIENVGPIDHLTIPLPEVGGVVVLKGRNGVGKSHALAAVDSLVGRRGRPVCRDHARRGLVEAFGARMTIGRSTRRTGEAEVLTLEGKLDIAQLVSPPIKDEEAADRTRIKALLQLSGKSVSAKTFASVVPDKDILLRVGDDASGDPVAVAAAIKRAIEAEARSLEAAAQKAAARAAAAEEEVPDGFALDDVPSRDDAERRLQDALMAKRELETRAADAVRGRERAEAAKKKLAAYRKVTDSPDDLRKKLVDTDEEITRLKAALAKAQSTRDDLATRLAKAERAEAEIAELEAIIKDVPAGVPKAKLDEAERAVAEARRVHDVAVTAEQVARKASVAAQYRSEAAELAERARAYRDAGHSLDDVLSDLVGTVTDALRVDGGRLVCETDRGLEPYAELSPGERWRIALEIAAEQVGSGGLVTVPQEAWEALDPIHRQEVAKIAKEAGVTVLTAEATDEETVTPHEFPEEEGATK